MTAMMMIGYRNSGGEWASLASFFFALAVDRAFVLLLAAQLAARALQA